MKTSTRPGRSLRRYVSLAAAGAMMMALMPAGQAAADHAPDARDTDAICPSDDPDDYNSEFDDVGSGPHWVNIVCMADENITEGLAPDGTDYGPRLNVTRGQMASFIVRFIEDYTGEAMPEGDPNSFSDVPEDDSDYVHASNIYKLEQADIVRGTAASDGDEYAPQRPVNRMQMGTFIRLALSWLDDREARNESAPPPAEHDWFPDPSAPVHEDNVDSIAEVGIVEGFDDGTYGPTEAVLRDQMASYIMRAYDYALVANLGPVPELDARITDAELDTRDSALDTPETSIVSEGDEWVITFSESMDTPDFAEQDVDTPEQGTTVDLNDANEQDFTVECLAESGDTTSDAEFVGAVCSFDDDAQTELRLEIDETTTFDYAVTITGIDLLTQDGESISLEDSEDLTIGEEFADGG